MQLLMWGVYPLLLKTSTDARAMYGVGIYIAIINVATIYLQSDSKKKIQIDGTVGYAPAIRNTIYNYPILKKLIPITFRENWSWGDYKLLNYYAIKNIIPKGKNKINKKKLYVLKDSMYHRILADKENILIELK